jgi:hypothetical protein
MRDERRIVCDEHVFLWNVTYCEQKHVYKLLESGDLLLSIFPPTQVGNHRNAT